MVTYRTIEIDGIKLFYREAGSTNSPTLVLLHGFPSSSHMFRDLFPKLSDRFHLIAPDYPGFGYSDAPPITDFTYTFDRLATVVGKLLEALKIEKYGLYMQDYGGPVGFRLATAHPERITGLIIQNTNAYVEGISDAFQAFGPFWADRNSESEKPVRGFLTFESTEFQYLHGASKPESISPDGYTLDQFFLDRPGNELIQLELIHDYPSNLQLYPEWQSYLKQHQPPTLVVSGKNDPFFVPVGQTAFQKDVPGAEIHLLEGGHFALEEFSTEIASCITAFLKPEGSGRQ